jgi:hypothetical protein
MSNIDGALNLIDLVKRSSFPSLLSPSPEKKPQQ